MEKKLKCGVVGVGYLGQHHARIYSSLENCQLVGVYDVSYERAKEIAALYNCKAYDNIELLADHCQAISVVVPTDKHCQVALPLLKKACHLLVEKPFCTSLEEAHLIIEEAKKNNCTVQVGHIEHYNPVMAYMEKNINSPKFITADRLAPFNPRGTEVGVVLDLMIHDIGVILKLAGSEVEKIESVGVRVLSKTEDIANTRITFKNGCVANLNTSRVSLKKVREVRIFQQQGYFSIDFMNQKGHLIKTNGKEIFQEELPIEKGEPLAIELASFTNCVLNKNDPKVNAKLGMKALEVALTVTKQINETF